MKLDSYTVFARTLPGVLSSIPFFVLHFFYLSPLLGQFWSQLLAIKYATNISISVALLYFLVQLSRFLSKEFFEKRLFNNGSSLPTTNLLLHADSQFSSGYKAAIHKKIKADFRISIPTTQEESVNLDNSRKVIGEAVGLMRKKVGKGYLLGQHNLEYGFVRNLAGGSLAAVFASLICIFIFYLVAYNKTALITSVVILCAYTMILLLSKKLIETYGQNYATVLIQEYMTHE